MDDKSSHLKKTEPVLVSACLLGISCRYDGCLKYHIDLSSDSQIIPIPVCPEQLGGLPTPRPACNLAEGDGKAVLEGKARVVNADGQDVTDKFIQGAREVCLIARLTGAKKAILKDKSPSCGTTKVKISEKWKKGLGVTASMLLSMGIVIVNEDQIKGL